MNIAEYKACLTKKEPLEVLFSLADNQSEMFVAYDDDVKIVLQYSDYFHKQAAENGKKYSAAVIRKPRIVLVTGVDEETKTVTVSYRKAVLEARAAAANKLDKQLENKEHVRMGGTVIEVVGKGGASFAVVQLDNNLRGVVWCREWSNDFTADLRALNIIGQRIEVMITGKYKSGEGASRWPYELSRRLAIGDPWVGIESRYHKGDIVNVLCGAAWGYGHAGKIEGEPELSVRMVPSQDKEKKILLAPGLTYQCVVTAINESNKTFRVMPFRLCNAVPSVKKVTIIT